MYTGLDKALVNGCSLSGNITHVGTRTVILHHTEHCKAFGEGTNIDEALQIADLDYESNFHEGIVNRQLPSLRDGDHTPSSLLDSYLLTGYKLFALYKDGEIETSLVKTPINENDEMVIKIGKGKDLQQAIEILCS